MPTVPAELSSCQQRGLLKKTPSGASDFTQPFLSVGDKEPITLLIKISRSSSSRPRPCLPNASPSSCCFHCVGGGRVRGRGEEEQREEEGGAEREDKDYRRKKKKSIGHEEEVEEEMEGEEKNNKSSKKNKVEKEEEVEDKNEQWRKKGKWKRE